MVQDIPPVRIFINSDQKTQLFLQSYNNFIFGYPSIVRFSWITIKEKIQKKCAPVIWYVILDINRIDEMKKHTILSLMNQNTLLHKYGLYFE